jgi:hypothetical protein
MRRFWLGLVAMMIISLPIVGCGGTDDGVAEGATAIETSTTQAPPMAASTTQASVGETSTSLAATTGDWTTIATLHSTDSPWQGMEGILISESFTVSGDAQLVLDMPDAGELDGVIVAVIPADSVADATALLAAIQDGVVVTLPAAFPTQAVSGLDGTYVLVNSAPASAAWSVELQARP